MNYCKVLSDVEWQEGKVVRFPMSSYRHRMVAVCYAQGRQTAQFRNGPGNYGVVMELVRDDGQSLLEGSVVVPVLPDGRVLMVVEQRPGQFFWGNTPSVIKLRDGTLNLAQYGPYSSLEFPGGSVNPGESFHAGFLRELIEETEVEEQRALLISRRVMHPSGADSIMQESHGVIYLEGEKFSSFTPSEDLHVLALHPEDVQTNIWKGNITSGQAALMPWTFYLEVKSALEHNGFLDLLEEEGYLTRQQVTIKRG